MKETPKSDCRAAWSYALKVLARRQHSTEEMRRKLERKGFAAEIVAATLKRLREAALLDDERFASDWVAYRLATRPAGRRRLQQELHRRGIPCSRAATVVNTLLDQDGELELARQAAVRYRRRRDESDEHYYRRLTRFLWQRGFAAGIVRRVAAEVTGCCIDSEQGNL